MDQKGFTRELDKMFREGRADEVPSFFDACMKKAEAENDKEGIAVILNEEVGYYRQNSDYEQGIASGRKAKKILEELGQQGTLPYAMTLLNLATIYRAAGELESAEKTYDNVYEIFTAVLSSDDSKFTEYYNNISLLYEEQGRFDKAEECLMEAIRIGEANGTTVYRTAVSYANLGQVLLMNKKTGLAMYYFINSDKLFNEKNLYDNHHALAISGMAEVMERRGEKDKALEYYRQALDMIESFIGRNKDWDRVYERYEALLTDALCVKDNDIDKREQKDSEVNGMLLAEDFYEKYGRVMIHEKFQEYESRIAVGKVGEGSECFGYDDAISRDHDFKPGFSMWLTDEDYDKIGVELQAEYDLIYDKYISEISDGIVSNTMNEDDEVTGRTGVRKISDFYASLTGIPEGPESIKDWVSLLSDEMIIGAAAATNGRIFRDDLGEFTRVRKRFVSFFPERLYVMKVAETVTRLGQAAQYNYKRAAVRGDAVSASLERDKAVRYTLYAVYLFNRAYHPHDKWMRKGIESFILLPELGYLLDDLVRLDVMDISANERYLELICKDIIAVIKEEGLVYGYSTFLPDYAAGFNRRIELMDKSVPELAAMIARLEFDTFDKVRNKGGRAFCQNDWPTFSIMRKSQYLNWTESMLIQYIVDFEGALLAGRNMITEKYGYMMESTRPEEFAEIKRKLPEVTEKKRALVDALAKIHVEWTEDFGRRYPTLIKHARTIHSSEDVPRDTSSETYLKGELYTYTDVMLTMYGRFIVENYKAGINLTEKTVLNTVKMYGYKDLEDAAAGMCDKTSNNQEDQLK
ncbi:MAG: DUF4125 family protein [Eubacterium sp.]|nr:DUF4125 family protein [Eubacterium sp.]